LGCVMHCVEGLKGVAVPKQGTANKACICHHDFRFFQRTESSSMHSCPPTRSPGVVPRQGGPGWWRPCPPCPYCCQQRRQQQQQQSSWQQLSRQHPAGSSEIQSSNSSSVHLKQILYVSELPSPLHPCLAPPLLPVPLRGGGFSNAFHTPPHSPCPEPPLPPLPLPALTNTMECRPPPPTHPNTQCHQLQACHGVSTCVCVGML